MSDKDQQNSEANQTETPVTDETAAEQVSAVDTSADSGADADVVVDTVVDDNTAEVADGEPASEEPVSEEVSETEEPVVATQPPVTEEPAAGGDDTVEQYLRVRFKNMADIPANTKTVIQRMERYTTSMAKNQAMGATKGSDLQRELFYTFMAALGGPDDSINPSLEAICWYFKTNLNNCFAHTHAYRFMNAVKLSKDQGICLQSLIHLFTLICEPGARSLAVKQIDIARATEKIADLRSRERLIAFISSAR